MKKTFWQKIPLIITPIALITAPLLFFTVSKNNVNDSESNNLNFQQEIQQIIHNQNLSLQEKIKQLQDKLKTLGNHTLDILKNLKAELDNLKHLNECQDYLTKLNLETNLSDKLPSEFSKEKNQLFDLKLLKLKNTPKFTNVDFEYKLIGINDNEGTLIIEINLKYQVKYMSTIQQTIHGFKKYDETSNKHFQDMTGFLAGLQNIKDKKTISLFPKEDKISALIDEIYDIFPNSKNYLTLKVANENTKISDFIDENANNIKLSLQLIDNKNQKTQQFKNVNFKITNHTIYLNSNNQTQITFDHDLSEINTKEIIKLGYYQESQDIVRAVEMPKTIEKVPSNLPSEITSLQDMFKDCENFNQDLSKWDTSYVTNMKSMFENASLFNQDLSSWNVIEVTEYQNFAKNSGFENNVAKQPDFPNNQPATIYLDQNGEKQATFEHDLSEINTTEIIRIGYYEVSDNEIRAVKMPKTIEKVPNKLPKKITSLKEMFKDCANFNQSISTWDVSKVTNMSGMFNNALKFNQDLSKWDTSNNTDMSYMFFNAAKFNNGDDIWQSTKTLNWNTTKVTNIDSMFFNAQAFNQEISNWNVSNVTNMSWVFFNAAKFNNGDEAGQSNKPLNWDVSNATNMDLMFNNAQSFNQDISRWNTSNVTSMYFMFENASAFNQDLSTWKVDKVFSYKDFATKSGFANERNKWPVKFR